MSEKLILELFRSASEDRKALKNEMSAFRRDMYESFKQAAADRAAMKAETLELRKEMKAETLSIRAEMKEGFKQAAVDREEIKEIIRGYCNATDKKVNILEKAFNKTKFSFISKYGLVFIVVSVFSSGALFHVLPRLYL